MRDAHGVVVNDVCKVIRRETVPFDNDEIVFLFWSAVTTIDEVSHLGFAGALEAYAVRFAVGSTAIRLCCRDVATLAVVVAVTAAFRGVFHIVLP